MKDTKDTDVASSKVNIRKDAKEDRTLPKGAKITRSETPTVEVEEIENGFIISKRVYVYFKLSGKDYTDSMCICQKWYSKEDPLQIRTDNKELADLFDE